MTNMTQLVVHTPVKVPAVRFAEVIFDNEDTGITTPIKARRSDNYLDGVDTYYVVELTPIFVDGCIKSMNTKLNNDEYYFFSQALDFLRRNKEMLNGYWINGKENTIIRLGIRKKTGI